MKKLILIFIFLCEPAFGCIVPQSEIIIHDSSKHFQFYDFVAYAELIEFIDITKEQQIVEFSINKVFKGPEVNSIVVNNYFSNSCSRGFLDKNSNYYLFLNKNDSNGNYSVHSGTFVQVNSANQHQLDATLSAHNKAFNSPSAGTAKSAAP